MHSRSFRIRIQPETQRCGSGMFIQDPGTNKRSKRGVNFFLCLIFFCGHKFYKLKIIYFWTGKEKIWPSRQRIIILCTEKLSLSSQKYGLRIRDPRSRKNIFRIPDTGVKKAPDPGSGFAKTGQVIILKVKVYITGLQKDFYTNLKVFLGTSYVP